MNKNAFAFVCIWILILLISCTPTTVVSTQSSTGQSSTGQSSAGQSNSQSPSYSGPKASVVVAEFECKAAKCNYSIGRGMADALISALVMSNRFEVLESSNNLGILQSELNVTGESSAFQGSDIAIIAAVTAFEPDASGIGGAGVVVPVPFIGGVSASKEEAYVAIDLRLVDIRTRRVVTVSKIEGLASRFGGGLYGGGILGGVRISGYQNTPMEKAIAELIDNAVLDIVNKVPASYYSDSRPVNAPVNTQASQTTPTTQPVQSSNVQTQSPNTPVQTTEVASSSIGSLEANVKLLPGNTFPFEDGFENFSLGQVVAVAAPQNYGIFRTDGKSGNSFAKIEETFDVNDQPNKALQINTTERRFTHGYLTTGNSNLDNYHATFDFKMKGPDHPRDVTGFWLVLNLDAAGSRYYNVRIASRAGSVTMAKVLGDQRVDVINRDGLGFDHADGLFHKAEVINQAGNIKVLVDGRILIDYNDTDINYHKGGFGLGFKCQSECQMFVDNLKIQKLP